MSTFLVVAHQTALSSELREALLAKSREDQRAIFTLLVPATPAEHLLEDEGTDAIGSARQALTQTVDSLEAEGIKFARCSIGDGNPLTAVREEFARSRRTYDGVILCTLPFGVSRWLDQGLIEQIEKLFLVPVTHVVAATPAIRERHTRATAIRVVTFSVRLGTPGVEIAREVADRLGFRYFDWEVTSEAASRAGVPPEIIAASQQAKSLLSRVVERLLVTGVYATDEELGRLSSTTMSTAIAALGSREYRSFVERVVLELGHHGDAIIVGHASQVILRYEPGVFKVLITGSEESRASYLAAKEKNSYEEALKMVRESDVERKSFFKQTYSVDLLDAGMYDLSLNTDNLSMASAVEAIVRLATSGTSSSSGWREETRDPDKRTVQVN